MLPTRPFSDKLDGARSTWKFQLMARTLPMSRPDTSAPMREWDIAYNPPFTDGRDVDDVLELSTYSQSDRGKPQRMLVWRYSAKHQVSVRFAYSAKSAEISQVILQRGSRPREFNIGESRLKAAKKSASRGVKLRGIRRAENLAQSSACLEDSELEKILPHLDLFSCRQKLLDMFRGGQMLFQQHMRMDRSLLDSCSAFAPTRAHEDENSFSKLMLCHKGPVQESLVLIIPENNVSADEQYQLIGRALHDALNGPLHGILEQKLYDWIPRDLDPHMLRIRTTHGIYIKGSIQYRLSTGHYVLFGQGCVEIYNHRPGSSRGLVLGSGVAPSSSFGISVARETVQTAQPVLKIRKSSDLRSFWKSSNRMDARQIESDLSQVGAHLITSCDGTLLAMNELTAVVWCALKDLHLAISPESAYPLIAREYNVRTDPDGFLGDAPLLIDTGKSSYADSLEILQPHDLRRANGRFG